MSVSNSLRLEQLACQFLVRRVFNTEWLELFPSLVFFYSVIDLRLWIVLKFHRLPKRSISDVYCECCVKDRQSVVRRASLQS